VSKEYSGDRRGLREAAKELQTRRLPMTGPLIPGEEVACGDHEAIARRWDEWARGIPPKVEQRRGLSRDQIFSSLRKHLEKK
jgi:hypothetical protein